MNDQGTSIEELKTLVRQFSAERDWEKFHLPKDLAVAMAIEVGEVLEHFRYKTDAQIAGHIQNADQLRELGYEFADIFWLLLRLCDVCGVDLSTALREKLVISAKKYPVERVKGKPDKYSEY